MLVTFNNRIKQILLLLLILLLHYFLSKESFTIENSYSIIILLLIFLFYYAHRYVFLLSPASHVAIRLQENDIVLICRDGSEVTGVIMRNSLVMPAITIMNILPHERMRQRSVVIFSDSMDAERFRELRVLLKWGGFAGM